MNTEGVNLSANVCLNAARRLVQGVFALWLLGWAQDQKATEHELMNE